MAIRRVRSIISKASAFRVALAALLFANLGVFLLMTGNANPNLPGDINDDNVVNISDLSILLSNWGKRYAPTPGPTPQPNPQPNPQPGPNPSPTTATCGGSANTPTAPLGSYAIKSCEDFNGSGIPSGWSAYNGGGGDTVVGAGRKPGQCTVGNGVLVQTQNSDGATCGMSHSHSQRYGLWEVRMRAYSTGSSGSAPHPVLIVWPDTEWEDGELDYFETDLGDPDMSVFLHCVGNPSKNCYSTSKAVDYTQWHTYSFEWTSAGFKGFIDGVQFYSTGPSGADMPVPGHQTIQLDNLSGDTPVKSGKMEVDWVHIYGK